ncbi:MAG: anthranilate phosphoribosyltransferase [Acidobacteriaceae bacterium]
MALHEYMKRVVEQREVLTRSQARALLDLVLAGSTEADQPGSPHSLQLAALLGAIAARGETAAELAGFAEAMLAAAIPVPLDEAERALLVDTCGTGGDDTGTFNISTAAALVATAAGATVAKHGNRAVTSLCGSADVLEALGIPISLTPAAGAASLRRHRFAFLHAPSLHPAMKAVMPIRRALGVRTAFNILGPLANPAGARAQVMGVYSAHLVPVVAEAMLLLGVRHAFVVHGDVTNRTSANETSATGSGIDEISISGPTQLAEVRGDTVTFSHLTPEQVGLESAPIDSLRGGDAAANAAILRFIFAGEPGPRRDVVLLNAAAVLIAADVVPSTPDSHEAFRAAIQLAARAIDSGSVTALVAALATQGAAETPRTEP